jgi:hypothetical protein
MAGKNYSAMHKILNNYVALFSLLAGETFHY